MRKFMKGIITLIMVMALMVLPSMSVFAASGNTTKVASSKMTINTGTMTYSGGAIVCNYLTVSGNGRTEQMAWTGKANQTLTTSQFLAAKANGTYTLSFNGTNMSILSLGTKTYKPSITIYWDDTF